jgi:hypothetical protein
MALACNRSVLIAAVIARGLFDDQKARVNSFVVDSYSENMTVQMGIAPSHRTAWLWMVPVR